MYNVLLVEDDLENCAILTRYLSKSGQYTAQVAHDAASALALAGRCAFDLVLMDIMLPDMDGVDLCVRLRRSMYCPIIFISCLDDEETIVRAIRLGGDDYLTKPFRYPVLQAHMEAVLRRVNQPGPRPASDIALGDWILSVKNHTLEKDGESVYLSPTEFELMMYFVGSGGALMMYEEIYQQIWRKPSYGDLRTVFSHVRNLRKKIEADPANPRYILTVPRTGYRFDIGGGRSGQ